MLLRSTDTSSSAPTPTGQVTATTTASTAASAATSPLHSRTTFPASVLTPAGFAFSTCMYYWSCFGVLALIFLTSRDYNCNSDEGIYTVTSPGYSNLNNDWGNDAFSSFVCDRS